MSTDTGSGSASGEPTDPLAALRAADTRPLYEQLRERIALLAGRALDSRVLLTGVLVALVVLVAARWLIASSEPPVEDTLPFAASPSDSAAIATSAVAGGATATTARPAGATVVVHVAGAVRRPGLVTGPAGWRVADAIDSAGGANPDADLDRVNLAALVVDAERLYVPTVGEETPPTVAGHSTTAESEGWPIDINTASPTDLERIPGIGPVTAESIVVHRDEHGPFASVDALVAVRGIGSATVESFRDHVTVG